jgi:glycosyl transferase family 25
MCSVSQSNGLIHRKWVSGLLGCCSSGYKSILSIVRHRKTTAILSIPAAAAGRDPTRKPIESMELTEFFDLTIIINAPHRTDRRIEMREALRRVDWDSDSSKVIWFDAIDPRSAVHFPNPGVRGCFLSHVAALNIAEHRGCRRALILEDDCEFTTDFKERQSQVAALLESNPWGIAYLGHAERVDGPSRLEQLPAHRNMVLAHCYAVTASVLPRLAGYLEDMAQRPGGVPEGGPMPLDGGISWFRRANPDVTTVMLSPSLANQRRSRSDLCPIWFDRFPGLSKVVRQARHRLLPNIPDAKARRERR